jgi:toxin ParE1/3/4
MVKIIWTEFAVEDLRSIHDYISKDSKHYADRYVDKIITRVEQLETNPQSGRVVPEFNLDKVRELLEGRYRIIYKINDGYIVIIRIHHSARQLKDV